jgi:hypothetical protein
MFDSRCRSRQTHYPVLGTEGPWREPPAIPLRFDQMDAANPLRLAVRSRAPRPSLWTFIEGGEWPPRDRWRQRKLAFVLIQGHLVELYGLDVSPDLVFDVTDTVEETSSSDRTGRPRRAANRRTVGPWQRGPTQSLTKQRSRYCLRSPLHALPEVFRNHRFPRRKAPGLSRLAR